MQDELECFKKCAELGCPDFTLHGRDIILFTFGGIWELLPNNVSRINRYAANVCECWWLTNFTEPGAEAFLIRNSMVRQARAFALKHGKE